MHTATEGRKEKMGSEKYNFKIDNIDPNTTHGMILSNIKSCSKVLECGCASGYMTQFMKEKLKCTVHVVEIDNNCFISAMEYAERGYCGDLDEDGWYNHFKAEQYDYILFADVLEHLKHPEDVLAMSSYLLKPGGKIIFSVPNICHNDIIIKLFYDHFNYTSLGLLDNTHIHFFGGRDLARFVDQAGLKIAKFNGIIIPTLMTEQAYPLPIDQGLLDLLKKRELGEFYQYVITCERK